MTMTEIAAHQAAEPEIDPELLAEAQRQLGDTWPNQAINEGLRLLVEQKRLERRRALEDLRRMSREGLFNYAALDEVDE
ncbi:DUF2191 domain-containing protein [Dactylosporangium sp. NPDC051485]|uniref:DUF2191 domain-containing protein n=1 Tax=Dactylosporangium sp. NPDC051485 TaxID=3154846 RepID=UPI00343CEBCA